MIDGHSRVPPGMSIFPISNTTCHLLHILARPAQGTHCSPWVSVQEPSVDGGLRVGGQAQT